jgi:hypothetical protein
MGTEHAQIETDPGFLGLIWDYGVVDNYLKAFMTGVGYGT